MEESTFKKIFLANYRVIYLLMVAIIAFGFLSINQMPKESSPEVNIPVVVITTPFVGAGAENVEDLVTRPIEKQLLGLSDVNSVNSSSQQGLSTVIVQFNAGANSSEIITEVRNRVSRARLGIPEGAGESNVQQISFSDSPIMRIVVAGSLELPELRFYAEQLKDELESIRNVSQVSLLGAPEREIRLRIDKNRLNELSISPEIVIRSLVQADVDLPIGFIETDGRVYALRLNSSISSVSDIQNLPVVEIGGAVINLGDIALVEDGFSSLGNISRFSVDGSRPEATISLQIFKEAGQGDILTIADSVKKKIQLLSTDIFPKDVEIEIIQSDAENISSDLGTLVSGGLLTIVIIVLILALFIGWREALLASLVVPFSFLSAFILIEAFGLTINFLTLFSLILSLGILVDASIVVTESIFQKRSLGLNGSDAAEETVKDFQIPLVAGTLTTVFVFVPMLLVGGIIGEFIKSIPLTVSSVLISSLFSALILITTIAARFFVKPTKNHKVGLWGVGNIMENISVWYRKKLEAVLEKKRSSYKLLGFVFIAFVFSVLLIIFGLVNVNMFPSPNSSTISIDFEAPQGTSLENTSDLIRPIEEVLSEDPNISSFLTVIGQDSTAGSIDIAQAGNSNKAGITAVLKKGKRPNSSEIVAYYRDYLRDWEAGEIRVSQTEAGPSTESAVSINLTGNNLDELELVARDLADLLRVVEGVENVNDGVKSTAGEFVVEINRSLAKRYGLSSSDVANHIRTSLFGQKAIDLRIGEDEIDVVVLTNYVQEKDRTGSALSVDVSFIKGIIIQTSRGPVTLDTFVDVSLEPGRGVINRRDGQRVLVLSSDVADGYNASLIVNDFQDKIKNKELPPGVEISYGGEVEEIQESFMDLARVMLVGVLAIFILMVSLFKSYKQSLFIIVTIPLALTGVLFGLALVRQPLSFPGFIGIVALAGVVVNNAIILIDTINRNCPESRCLKDSILEAARTRFRPVALTTITTVFGLLPLVFISPVWAPVAYSIIFGLVYATILTLVVVPVLYNLFSKKDKDSSIIK